MNVALKRSTGFGSCATIAQGGITMREQIEVVYENGLLRPIAPLPGQFYEHQHLTVTIEDSAARLSWLADANPTISLESVRQALGKTPGTLAQLIQAEREER
jgi:predicted DNA-binding antitoxin AbrB/MazE fold protein